MTTCAAQSSPSHHSDSTPAPYEAAPRAGESPLASLVVSPFDGSRQEALLFQRSLRAGSCVGDFHDADSQSAPGIVQVKCGDLDGPAAGLSLNGECVSGFGVVRDGETDAPDGEGVVGVGLVGDDGFAGFAGDVPVVGKVGVVPRPCVFTGVVGDFGVCGVADHGGCPSVGVDVVKVAGSPLLCQPPVSVGSETTNEEDK